MSEMKAGAILAEAAKTYNERNAVYGDNYKRVGKAMEALFPDGIVLKGEQAFNRWHILELAMVKLSRYAVSMERGGSHRDSLRDLAVYAAILEEIDTACGFFDEDPHTIPSGIVERIQKPPVTPAIAPSKAAWEPDPVQESPIPPESIVTTHFNGFRGTACTMHQKLRSEDGHGEFEPIAEDRSW